jgi:hypothetical protein
LTHLRLALYPPMNDEKGRAEGGDGPSGHGFATERDVCGLCGLCLHGFSAWELDEPLGLFLTETGARGFPIWKDGQPPQKPLAHCGTLRTG